MKSRVRWTTAHTKTGTKLGVNMGLKQRLNQDHIRTKSELNQD